MNFNVESNLEPETSSMSDALYDCIPPELVIKIDGYLSFEDSLHFQQCSNYIKSALCSNWCQYDKIQISDDPVDCCIISTKRRAPKRNFLEASLNTIFITCDKIVEIMMIMKDIGSLQKCNSEGPQLLRDTSLYQTNGYLGYLFSKTPPQVVAQLKIVSLHVDIMRENLRQLCFPCPTQDLLYSIHHLADSHFETFIQQQYSLKIIYLRNMLLNGMEMTLKNIAKYCAKTDFTIDAAEGYADMTVEKGKMEYSFAFFYYNPHICGIEPQSTMEGIDQTNEQLINSSFPDRKLMNNNDRNDNNDSNRNDNSSSSSIGCSSSSSRSSSSSSDNSSNSGTLVCMNAPNQIYCQSDLQTSEAIYTSLWRSLTKTH